MVRFFNQKEEVIKIELTPYGRQRFSEGTFNPAYYAFYDSSILYDGDHGNLTETQNEIVTRISTQTPRIRPMTRYKSEGGSIVSLGSTNTSAEYIQDEVWNSKYQRPLGSSDPNSNYAPAWKINLLSDSDIGLHDGVEHNLDNLIPQMSATLLIDYNAETIPETNEELFQLVSSQKLLLDIEEINTVFKNNGNFDIEVMISGSDGVLTPMSFIGHSSLSAGDLISQIGPDNLSNMMNGTEEEVVQGFPILDHSYSEFYLDISADAEISDFEMVSNSSMYKTKIDKDPRELCDDGMSETGSGDGY
jgi:hypothetical protein